MAPGSRESWSAVSPFLDEALTLPEAQRAGWLAELEERDPELAAQLRTLLNEHRALDQEGFLEGHVLGSAGAPGEVIGAYRLLAPIGYGGMGTVWRAERSDGRFERQVAVKFPNVTFAPRNEERFRREHSILGRLTHPNIAQLLDAGLSAKGQPFLILEYVEGEPIDRYCDRLALKVEARLRLFLDVLGAVAHAHSHLIVHRDIKPSNVMVATDGAVKLLDFGIAKLLEDQAHGGTATILTREGGVALTPEYAAPEQMTGGAITTATDVYSLGVLFYVLLTGEHPAGAARRSPAELVKAVVETEVRRLSDTAGETSAEAAAARGSTPEKLRRMLRGDLDIIAARMLKKDPRERYPSVAELAEDLRRYLTHQPITARADTVVYRTRKFLRRQWLPVAAATLVMASLSAGLWIAERERERAQRRFSEVRQLSNKLFDIDARVRRLPGSADTRQLIVDTSLEYLRRLAVDAQGDPELALDVGTAYMRVGRVQGVPISPNLGQIENAEQNLRLAERLVHSVLAAQPSNRTALLRAAQIAHDRMVLAQARRPDTEALPLAFKAEEWLQKYLSTGEVEAAEKTQVVIVGMNVANWYVQKERMEEGLRLLGRTIEIAKATDQPRQAGAAQIVTARALRSSGDLDGALAAIREGVRLLEPPPGERTRASSFELALVTQGEILGEEDSISLGRSLEAAELFERAMNNVADLVRQDPNDAGSRFAFADDAIKLAAIRRHSNPPGALALYDQALARLAEIKNHPRARRDEVRALAGSSYPLRQTGNTAEAAKRLDLAFSRLSELKLYPAEQVQPGWEAEKALRALADHQAATGNVPRAIETYEELLGKLNASGLKPESNLSHALSLSRLYQSLGALYGRNRQPQKASELQALRLDLWRHWDRKLRDNPFISSQLDASR